MNPNQAVEIFEKEHLDPVITAYFNKESDRHTLRDHLEQWLELQQL